MMTKKQVIQNQLDMVLHQHDQFVLQHSLINARFETQIVELKDRLSKATDEPATLSDFPIAPMR